MRPGNRREQTDEQDHVVGLGQQDVRRDLRCPDHDDGSGSLPQAYQPVPVLDGEAGHEGSGVALQHLPSRGEYPMHVRHRWRIARGLERRLGSDERLGRRHRVQVGIRVEQDQRSAIVDPSPHLTLDLRLTLSPNQQRGPSSRRWSPAGHLHVCPELAEHVYQRLGASGARIARVEGWTLLGGSSRDDGCADAHDHQDDPWQPAPLPHRCLRPGHVVAANTRSDSSRRRRTSSGVERAVPYQAHWNTVVASLNGAAAAGRAPRT